MAYMPLRLRFPTTVAILLALVASAQGNGRFTATTDSATNPDITLVSTTFGLLISKEDGQNFRWVCEAAVGYTGTFDPDYSITEDGTIYATNFSGLSYSKDGACSFEPAEFYGDPTGGDTPELLSNIWISEVEVASDGKIWASTATTSSFNDIYVSADGHKFESANNYDPTAWWRNIRIAYSDPNTVYASGYKVEDTGTGEPSKALLRKTIDGGQTWIDLSVADFTFGLYPNILLEGVSPNDPNIVFARVLNVRAPTGDDLYRSTDGGVSWELVLEMAGTISAFLIRSDGRVLVGTVTPCAEDLVEGEQLPNKGCVRISANGAKDSWTTPAIEPKLACLSERGADQTLYGCAQNWDPDNFAFGTSADNGNTWDKVMRFSEISGPLLCPTDTVQYNCIRNEWLDLCAMLGLCTSGGAPDAGTDATDAGTPGEDEDAKQGGCGCQSGTTGGLGLLLSAVALFVLRFRGRPTR